MNENMLAIAAKLPDVALLNRLEALAKSARNATAELIACLSELQVRKAHRGEGPGSLFEYCTQVLRLSQAAAFNRLAAASAARKFPMILDLLADGSINLTTVRVLATHLTSENHRMTLREAIGRTKDEVLEIVARLSPRPDVPASIRKLPSPAQPVLGQDGAVATTRPIELASPCRPEPATAGQRPVVAPLSPERYRVQFTIGKETQEKLRRLQDLARRELPDGDLGTIFDRGITLLLREVEKQKFSATTRPRAAKAARPGSRDIPANVERAVWKRDGGRCAFVGRKGRCMQRSFLEFHHIEPHAGGGAATTDNISLRCRAHNVYESELTFGPFDGSIVRERPATYELDFLPPATCPGTGSKAARFLLPLERRLAPALRASVVG